MARNKVVYYGETLIDLTSDTVAADKMLSGITAHDKSGAQVTGTLVLQTVRIGTSDPSNSVGNNGDIYIKVASS